MAARKGSSMDLVIALAVFVGVLVVYVLTLCPTAYPGESLDAVIAATGMGLVKSVAYPVWRLVGRILMGLSTNKAYVLNLISAIFGAATIGLLYRLFSRFGHARTRDELIRFRGQPNLVRWAALSAALLVAFSHTFWRASVTAGTDTLNAFMLMLVTHFLVRYRETRKKRYFMAYAIVYSVALANFPTMLLLLPIYLVLSIMWCREAYNDLIILGATILISAFLFGFAVFSGPLGFAAAHRAEYYLQPLQITRPVFSYVTWYWSNMRGALPVGGMSGALQWLLALVLPTLPPVLYLTFTKPGRGGEIGRASTITDGIFRFLAFAYTIFGILALFDLFVGPHVTLRSPQNPEGEGFLVAYMVLGGWVCYMLGYWAVMFTSRPATSPEGRRSYSRPAYAALVAVLLVLPAANLVKHMEVDHSGLSGFTLVEDFARDTIMSAASGDRDAVLIVTDGWGSLLRYVHENRMPKETAAKVQIVDAAAAAGLDGVYLDRRKYLSVEIVGQVLAPQADPARDPDVTDTEAVVRYMRSAVLTRTRAARDVYLTDDRDRLDPDSDEIAYYYELVPQGLLYRLVPRRDFTTEPDTLVASGRALWGKLRLGELQPRPLGSWPRSAYLYLLRASKLANDFGVYCHKYADADTATGFYRKALGYYDMNYSAIRNLQIVDAAQTPPKEDADLKDRLNEATLELNNRITTEMRRYAPGAAEEVQQKLRKYLEARLIMDGYGLVRDAALLADFAQNNPDQAAVSRYEYIYGLYSLMAQVDPKGDEALFQRAQATLRRSSQLSTSDVVQALMDLEKALAAVKADPTRKPEEVGAVYSFIGTTQRRLRNFDAAEAAFKQALELAPDSWDTKLSLADVYAASGRLSEALAIVRQRLDEQPPSTAEELGSQLNVVDQWCRAAEEPNGLADFARQYAATHPDKALDAMLFAVDRALGQRDQGLETARALIAELETAHGGDPRLLVRKVQLAVMEKRYDDALAIEVPTEELSEADRARYLGYHGLVYLDTGKPVEALNEIEAAYNSGRAAITASYRERDAAAQDNPRLLSAIQQEANAVLRRHAQPYAYSLWLASLEAWAVERTPELATKAQGYAMLYRQLLGADAELVADAVYGWTALKTQGNLKLARALIEPAYLGMPDSGGVKVYYGTLLIREGHYKEGVTLLQRVLDSTMELSIYDRTEAQQLVDEYRAHLEESPGEAGTTPESGTSTESNGSGDTGTTDTGTTDTGTDAPISE